MIANVVGMLIRSLVTGSLNRDEASKGAIRKAYFNWVVCTIVSLPVVLFAFFAFAGAMNLAQGYDGSWQILLIGLGGMAVLGWYIAREFVGRTAQWTDDGVAFHWFNGEANLTWDAIDSIEVRPHRRNYARIRFRDGRTFGVSAFLSGGNALLSELARHGVGFVKWGTSEPLEFA